MAQSHEPDGFRSLAEIASPDKTWEAFFILDDGPPPQKTLADHHCVIAEFAVNQSAPDKIRVHFDTARNLLLYAWFEYRFLSVAEAHAFASVEMALRMKLGYPETEEHNPGLKKLLRQAIDTNLLVDHKLRHVQRRIAEANNCTPMTVDVGSQNFMRTIMEFFPKCRNNWAHGSTGLHGSHYFVLETCCDIINQLYSNEGCLPN